MKTRILYFQAHPVYGATENYLSTLAKHLNKATFDVGILYPNVSALQPFSQIREVQPLAADSKYFSGNLIRNAYSIAKIIRKFRPDILHINDPSSLGAIAARLAGVKKVVITHHTPELKVQYNWKGNLAKKLTIKLTNYFIFTSSYDKKMGVKSYNIPVEKSRVITYGLETNTFLKLQSKKDNIRANFREKLKIPHDHTVIASAGRLEAQKAQLDLIQAANIICSRHNNVTFVIVGEGSLRSQLEHQINNLGLARKFLLPGFVNNIEEFLCAVDIFAMSSLFEGLCYAVVEASAMGIPVVSTAVGGINYSIADGKTGILVEPGYPEKFAEKLNWLIENPGIGHSMGKNGQERFHQLFTIDKIILDINKLYHELTK